MKFPFSNFNSKNLTQLLSALLPCFVAVLGVFTFSASIVEYKSVSVSSSSTYKNRELPIYCVETDKKQIALTFDAAWGNEDTIQIMEILKKHDVKVTFFMTGGWVNKYPEDVKMIYEEGHDLGNHSENHKNMSQLSNDGIKEELLSVHERVKELTGYNMFLFRPPYGDYDNEVIRCAKEIGYYTIQWDVDTIDIKVMTI